jgi:hypothetical protein
MYPDPEAGPTRGGAYSDTPAHAAPSTTTLPDRVGQVEFADLRTERRLSSEQR